VFLIVVTGARLEKEEETWVVLVQVAWNAQKHSVTIFFCCIAN